MTNHVQTATTTRAPTDPRRKTALIAGALYLLTFISIPTLGLYSAVQKSGYILGAGPDTAVIIGAILELIVAFACIGTAVVLFPVVKRQNEGLALGFVGARVLEAATIFAGVVTLLAIVSLRRAGAGADGLVASQALVELHRWTFLLGQGLIPGVNALLLGTLLYQSRLVPRILPTIGLFGAFLLVASDLGTMFDLWPQVSAPSALGALPIAVWEFSLGVWLVVKGFTPASVAAESVPQIGPDAALAAWPRGA